MFDLVPFLILIVLAVLVVVVAGRLRFPYTIALVGLGFLIGLAVVRFGYSTLPPSIAALLTPPFFFDILLPPIVFEAAIHIDYRLLRGRLGIVLFLVVGGVLFTTLFTGVLVAYLFAIPLLAALLLASILSPTDPVAVIDLFRRLDVPAELSTIVESESLLNDAVGIIVFLVVLQLIVSGTASPGLATIDFLKLSLIGVGVGALVAGGVYFLSNQLEDATAETALSVVAAYGSYLLAVGLGGSGIVAAAIAGIAIGNFAVPRALRPAARQSLATFWKVIVYMANSVIFLTMGLLFALANLGSYLVLIAVVFGVILAGRAIFTYAHRPIARAIGGSSAVLPTSWYNVVALAGIRGAIPIVLALSLLTVSTPLAKSTVDTIVAVTLGVAFVSIVFGNVTSEWYARREFGERAPRADGSESLP
ncbi:MAG TPA: cation:proton antiporter [Thermoplasmata archaeon]|jgi:CPA1 family monovalent cation:H+ antiporter|nr:cation:proton antiporter [Thermoplasmata archaeon]